MSIGTLIIFLIMYLYGFGLMIWTIFIDKHPTKLSLRAAKIGLAVLILTLCYFIYTFATGMQILHN